MCVYLCALSRLLCVICVQEFIDLLAVLVALCCVLYLLLLCSRCVTMCVYLFAGFGLCVCIGSVI